jgi:CPA2 family monovalent cation:H+ antiporter-2
MSMEQVGLLADLAIIFSVSLVVVLAFHRLRLPPVPGFIVAGVLLGPNALGLVSDVSGVERLADVGVILLLFTVGIEFSAGRLRALGLRGLGVGLTQVVLTTLVAAAACLALAARWQTALFVGFLVALSSTAIVLKILADRGEVDAPHGRLATAVLILQDLCIVPMMLVLPFLSGQATGGVGDLAFALGKAALVVAGTIVAARALVPRALSAILATRSRELFLIAVILVGTLTALGTAAAGASLALGAFLAGLVLSESDYGHQALAELLPFRDVFISLFFVTVGMLVDFGYLRQHALLVVTGVAAVLGGKTVLAAVGPALAGYAGRVSLLAGLAVAQIGEFSFVLAREGRAAGLLGSEPYQAFLAVAVFTMLVTPFVLAAGPALVDRLDGVVRLLPGRAPLAEQGQAEPLVDHVIVVGYGLNGQNLATALRSIHVPHVVVDVNAANVRQARARGEAAFYGDATREEILRGLGVERARLLVIAISDPEATRRVVRIARGLNAALHIIARTRYVVEIPELTRLGANAVIPEEFETSIEIFARVLGHYGVPRAEVDRLVSEVRAGHYAALLSPEGKPAGERVVTGVPQLGVERLTLEPGAHAVGRALAQLQLRTRTGALVLCLTRAGEDLPTPDPRLPFAAGDLLLIAGQPAQLTAARRLLTAGPEGTPARA